MKLNFQLISDDWCKSLDEKEKSNVKQLSHLKSKHEPEIHKARGAVFGI